MQGLAYHVDLVFCIDATGSMGTLIDAVKQRAIRFYDDVTAELEKAGKSIAKMRVKVICYRDIYADGRKAFVECGFFDIPQESDKFKGFLDGIRADGGGDEPESGLEGLALALRSKWTNEGDRQRHVIVIWTDASAHKLPIDLGKRQEELPETYPKDLPMTFTALTDLWHSQEMSSASRRLLIFGPDAYPWNSIAEYWENTLHHTSRAGEGLKDVDYATMLDLIARSVG